jgi:multiple sugar transport system substrate-binding protein
MYTGFATQFWSYGASDFENGRCALAAPASVQATADFIAALRDAGPSNWLDQRWYELALDFAHGEYALLVDSDHYVAYFEDPAYSELVGGIRYAPPPFGPSGSRRPNLWTWSVVMNSRVRDPSAAWQFFEWATGSEFLRRSAFEGNMNPTRSSIWDDERFRDHTSGWGDFYDVARSLIERDAFVLVTPAPNYLEIANRWVQALLDLYTGRNEIADALETAAADIDKLVGHDL